MQVIRKFTTAAYQPRTDSRSVQYRDAKLDLVYTVHSSELPKAPSASKFNIVFLHGAQFTKEGWYYWINKCFEEYGDKLDKCIALDHVQHGESALANEGKVGYFIPWDDLGRDTGCLIRDCIRRGEIHRDSPLIVIAHSMGGTGAMSLSVFDPGLVSALVLIDPVWMGLGLELRNVDQISGRISRMSYASYKRTRDTFKNLEDYYDYMENKSLYSKLHPKIKKDIIDALYVSDGKGGIRTKMSRTLQAAAYYSGLSAVGMGESLVRRVKLPTFIIHGSLPDFNPGGSNESLEEVLLTANRKTIEDAGHLVCYTHPDECFNAVKGFIMDQYKSHLVHFDKVDQMWGPTAEERFVAQMEAHGKGLRSAGFSRL